MNARIPVTIITGLLGAGKTTILANLLKKTQGKRYAVMVNEFGEVSVDDAILKKHAPAEAGEFYNFANGLLAYSADQRFLETMQELKQNTHLIDHVVLETSGLAVPSAVIEALQAGQLADSFVLDATLVIVDTPWLLARKPSIDDVDLSLSQVFCSQLECADIVVLNKIDAMSENELLKCEDLIRTAAPSVRFIELAYGAEIDVRVALGLRLNESTSATTDYRVTAVRSAARAHNHKDGHDHSGLGAHEHGILTHQHLHVHDPGWVSFALHSHAKQKRNLLKEALAWVADTERVLRMKGDVWLDDADEPTLVQGVGARIELSTGATLVGAQRQPSRYLAQEKMHRHMQEQDNQSRKSIVSDLGFIGMKSHSHADKAHEDRMHTEPSGSDCTLVFIGYHIDRKRVAGKLSEYTATNWH